MIKSAMQEGIADKLPRLEVATVQGPESKLRGNVVQQKYDDTGNDNTDGNRWLCNTLQFYPLVQRYTPKSLLFWFTILQ